MHRRNLYLKKIIPFVNKPVMKVITGMRRVGKSYLLKLIIESLRAQKSIGRRQILYINKESLDYDFIKDYKDLHRYVKASFKSVEGSKYLFVDEIQEIHNWEKTFYPFFLKVILIFFLLDQMPGTLYHFLSQRVRGFEECRASTIFRKFINMKADVGIRDGDIVVKFPRRAHNPIIKSARLDNTPSTISWLGNRKMLFEFR